MLAVPRHDSYSVTDDGVLHLKEQRTFLTTALNECETLRDGNPEP